MPVTGHLGVSACTAVFNNMSDISDRSSATLIFLICLLLLLLLLLLQTLREKGKGAFPDNADKACVFDAAPPLIVDLSLLQLLPELRATISNTDSIIADANVREVPDIVKFEWGG